MKRIGRLDEKAAKSVPDGTLISSTMIVMMMAITPSVKASRRPHGAVLFESAAAETPHISFASKVISALRTFETGQFFLPSRRI